MKTERGSGGTQFAKWVFLPAGVAGTVEELRARGWRSEGEAFEIPNGPCYRFADPSGNPYALFQNDRQEAMERAYADPDNAYALARSLHGFARYPCRPKPTPGRIRWCCSWSVANTSSLTSVASFDRQRPTPPASPP